MRPLFWPANVGSQRNVWRESLCRGSSGAVSRGERAGLGSSPGPSEAPAGGADGARGISGLLCEAVLAGGEDVSKSICYRPWRSQRELSPA